MVEKIIISTANSRKSLDWKATQITIPDLFQKLSVPSRGTETLAQYRAMKKQQQDILKDIGGFVGGALEGTRRKAGCVRSRSLVTLDFDSIPSGATSSVLEAVKALGCCFCVYSTRKHTPEAPRLRIIFPSDRDMNPDEYEPCARYLADRIGINMADPTTFEVARLMYWPSCCADSEYVFKADSEKPCFSVDSVLQQYVDWHDCAQWPQVNGLDRPKQPGRKQGDPETKPGIVGAFCRTYDIYRAMEELLPGVYEPVDGSSDRYTYTGGSTTGGAVVYDSGKFLFSHHATDPCSGLEVNSFDMVRLHKYGELDDEADPQTPKNRLPSFKAMCEYANSLNEVALRMYQDRQQAAVDDFKGVGTSDDSISADWRLKLKRNTTGSIVSSIENYALILENDPALTGRILRDGFADRALGIAPLPWGGRSAMQDGMRFLWSDSDDSGLRAYFERLVGGCQRGKLDDALADHFARHEVNPVMGYLNGLIWDEQPRLDTLFIDYLGADDSPYVRTVTRKAFTAAVARAMNPGCKFDNMLILCGPQGIGKSTILDKMSRGFFNDSIRTFEGKEASELLQGVWIVEVAELDAFRRSDVACIKQFLSLRADRYRASYGRRTGEHLRTCVFFGTCNQLDFLQDTTGNRRFWPVDVGRNPREKSVFDDLTDDVIAQVWAEAKARWQAGEPLYLDSSMEAIAAEKQEEHRDASPLEGQIAEFLDRRVPDDWAAWSRDKRRDFWSGCAAGGSYTLVERRDVCVAEVAVELLSMKDADLIDRRLTSGISKTLDRLGWERIGPRNHPLYGSQRMFRRPSKPV